MRPCFFNKICKYSLFENRGAQGFIELLCDILRVPDIVILTETISPIYIHFILKIISYRIIINSFIQNLLISAAICDIILFI